jgi:hypothetical protein
MTQQFGTAIDERQSERFRFECATCGSVHEGVPSFGWGYPVQYLAVPEAERSARVRLSDDVCLIDDEWFFVRGCLEIPVQGHAEPLTYGVWLSLSRASFSAYSGMVENVDRASDARFFGWLCTAIPGYPDTQLLKTTVHVRGWPARPLVELEPTDHPLAIEQRQGVPPWRLQQIVERVMHPRHR